MTPETVTKWRDILRKVGSGRRHASKAGPAASVKALVAHRLLEQCEDCGKVFVRLTAKGKRAAAGL